MKNREVIKNDITFIEACKLLKKSRKTISRYIKKGLLKPERIKSQRGTLEYRFKQADLKGLKTGIGKTRTDKTRQVIRQDSEVITLLKETTKTLRDQLAVKDKQIKSLGNKIDGLIERGRETNILIKGLTNKVLMLEGKTEKAETINEVENKDKDREDRKEKTGQDIRQDTGQKIKDFIRKIFKKEV